MAATMAAIMEITENIMRRMHEPSTKLHNALYFMSGMMVVILALVIVVGVKTKAENTGSHIADDTENSYEQQVAGQTDTTQDSGQEKWQEGVVTYEGKEYLYNTDIKTYLMMGVDINGPVQQSSRCRDADKRQISQKSTIFRTINHFSATDADDCLRLRRHGKCKTGQIFQPHGIKFLIF